MANELIVNASLPETRIALMESGEIQELLIERASGKGIVGNIYKGRVTRVLPGMQAAFVDIGLEKAAFLYVDDVYVHPQVWAEEEGESGTPGKILVEESGLEAEAGEGEEQLTSDESTQNQSQPEKLVQGDSIGDTPKEFDGGVQGEAQNPKLLSPTESLSESEDFEGREVSSSEVQNETRHWIGEEGVEEGQFDDQERAEFQDVSPDESEDDEDDRKPIEMGSDQESDQPSGTLAPSSDPQSDQVKEVEKFARENDAVQAEVSGTEEREDLAPAESPRKRPRRGRRSTGGRFRKKSLAQEVQVLQQEQKYPENYHEHVADVDQSVSDRAGLSDAQNQKVEIAKEGDTGRPESEVSDVSSDRRIVIAPVDRSEFKSQRARDRRIRQKATSRPMRPQVNIQDLLKEGQEVLVQVAKDPIATKGARLTCHISLPGRHLVCMPTIDHVGVSRRIEREDERRRLREYVERNRPKNLGFIVRTASGRQQSEKRIKQDIDYLTRLWTEIKEKAVESTAPALVYEDLNSVLRAIRDWVTEEIDKVIVDSRYHYNEVLRFVSHFMPSLKQKVELYHGDIPIFDAYSISTELSRALERKVWLKSGGYIVIDQAEALVAIDVNTGRYVGKKNLEDTILKTNLEAVQEIAYQLRLRNCGGIIILDLIDMEKDENKQRVYRALEDALSRDRARPTILKISELGLVEMTRKRTRDTIIRTLCESCTHCEGKGFIKSKQTIAYEVMREVERAGIERDVNKLLVQAHSEVIDILAIEERETLDQIEKKYRKQIYLQAVADFHPEQFEVTADKRERTERGRDQAHERFSSQESSPDRNRNRDRERHRNYRNVTPSSSSAVITPLAQNGSEPSYKGSAKKQEGVYSQVSSAASVEGTNSDSALISEGVSIAPEGGDGIVVSSRNKSDEFFDEEDRLAFLRAQAAQDAALARLGGGSHPISRTNHEQASVRGVGGPGNRRGVRGKRGGKFRRGPDRNNRGVKQFGYGTQLKKNDAFRDSSDSSSGSDGDGNGGDTSGDGQSRLPV